MPSYQFLLHFHLCLFIIYCYSCKVEGGETYHNVATLLGKGAQSSSMLIKLNVGGKEYETSLYTLTRINNTYFTALLSKTQELVIDDKGRIFIDRNGDIFNYVLEYLRNDTHFLPKDRHEHFLLKYEAKFYQLDNLFAMLPSYFNHGTLLDLSQQIILNAFYGITNQQWKLLYKATQHGFAGETFHALCDDKGPTMTVIKSAKGFMFGGYTRQSWAGIVLYKSDPSAFVFTLINPHGIAATKFLVGERVNYAVHIHKDLGPIFGGRDSKGHDILISNSSNINNNSYTDFGSTYIDTTGKGPAFFTGSKFFQVADIEVFGLML